MKVNQKPEIIAYSNAVLDEKISVDLNCQDNIPNPSGVQFDHRIIPNSSKVKIPYKLDRFANKTDGFSKMNNNIVHTSLDMPTPKNQLNKTGQSFGQCIDVNSFGYNTNFSWFSKTNENITDKKKPYVSNTYFYPSKLNHKTMFKANQVKKLNKNYLYRKNKKAMNVKIDDNESKFGSGINLGESFQSEIVITSGTESKQAQKKKKKKYHAYSSTSSTEEQGNQKSVSLDYKKMDGSPKTVTK